MWKPAKILPNISNDVSVQGIEFIRKYQIANIHYISSTQEVESVMLKLLALRNPKSKKHITLYKYVL